jgi:hypothetical protein
MQPALTLLDPIHVPVTPDTGTPVMPSKASAKKSMSVKKVPTNVTIIHLAKTLLVATHVLVTKALKVPDDNVTISMNANAVPTSVMTMPPVLTLSEATHALAILDMKVAEFNARTLTNANCHQMIQDSTCAINRQPQSVIIPMVVIHAHVLPVSVEMAEHAKILTNARKKPTHVTTTPPAAIPLEVIPVPVTSDTEETVTTVRISTNARKTATNVTITPPVQTPRAATTVPVTSDSVILKDQCPKVDHAITLMNVLKKPTHATPTTQLVPILSALMPVHVTMVISVTVLSVHSHVLPFTTDQLTTCKTTLISQLVCLKLKI